MVHINVNQQYCSLNYVFSSLLKLTYFRHFPTSLYKCKSNAHTRSRIYGVHLIFGYHWFILYVV